MHAAPEEEEYDTTKALDPMDPIELHRYQQSLECGSRPITAKKRSDFSHLRIQLLPRLRLALHHFLEPVQTADPPSNKPHGLGRSNIGMVAKADETLSRHQKSLGSIFCVPQTLPGREPASKSGQGQRGRRRNRTPEECHNYNMSFRLSDGSEIERRRS